MNISNEQLLTAALTIAEGCKERQGCLECPMSNICVKKNRHRPPEDWEKLLVGKSKVNRKGGDHTKKEGP